MKITAVEAYALDVPIAVRHRSDPFIRRCVLVRIDTDEGVTGYGYAPTPGEWNRIAVHAINTTVGQHLVGLDPANIAAIVKSLSDRFNRSHGTGLWSTILSALDIGLWDLKGKALGTPVSKLLGGARTSVPVYITFGIAEYSTEQLLETVTHLAGQGHTRFKMIVGGLRSTTKADSQTVRAEAARGGESHWFQGFAEDLILEDVRRVEAVRKALGPDIGLMVDGNGAFSFGEAKRLAQMLEPSNLIWFEEPIIGNDPELLAKLRAQTSVPISAGQHLGDLHAHKTLIDQGSYDVCQFNVTYCGGISEGVKVANLAEAFRLPIAVGSGQPYHNLPLHAGVTNGGLVEFHWLSWKVGEALFVDPPQPKDGWVEVSDLPGLGLVLKDNAIEQFRV